MVYTIVTCDGPTLVVMLQDTIKARLGSQGPESPIPGTLAPDESLKRGWYPHDKPFLWPAPRDPASYNTHPLKPSDYRVQQLDEPWEEGAMLGGLNLG